MSANADGSRFRFGRFELDLDAETLRRDGRPVRIQPQPLRVLAILVRQAGEVVGRDLLRNRVWDAATFVEFDQGLNYCIRRIRVALRDNADAPTYIETVKKRGYRFIAPVEPVSASVEPLESKGAQAAGVEPTTPTSPVDANVAITGSDVRSRRRWLAASVLLAVALVTFVFFVLSARPGSAARPLAYSQITSFRDDALSPAISPDGRMVAFIVGSGKGFLSRGEIYTKVLPDGEPTQRTRDSWPKYGVAFSPDGTGITYTVVTPRGWDTAILPVTGGDARTLLTNAAGLSWLDADHVLFSEIKTGLHLGLVTSTTSRSNVRDVYLPAHERGMAHYSYPSPDRKWVLVVEKGPDGGWERCRLVPFDGTSTGSQVGPGGACSSAAWSPDGRSMYFTATVDGTSHLWRQTFPAGAPEQLTSSPAEERGVAVSPAGDALITSLGITESGLWLHDSRGDRLIASHRLVFRPSFSADGRVLYYLARRSSTTAENELWATNLETGSSELILQGFGISSYDLSPDGSEILFAAPQDGASQIWRAPRDRRLGAPKPLAARGDDSPLWGHDGTIVFTRSEDGRHYLFAMNSDGTAPAKIRSEAIIALTRLSPNRKWAVTMVATNEAAKVSMVAVPLDGGATRRICRAACMVKWSLDGTRLYIKQVVGGKDGGSSLVIAVRNGESLPSELPAEGLRPDVNLTALPGATRIDLSRFSDTILGSDVEPGRNPDVFAYVKSESHYNLFRIQLR